MWLISYQNVFLFCFFDSEGIVVYFLIFCCWIWNTQCTFVKRRNHLVSLKLDSKLGSFQQLKHTWRQVESVKKQHWPRFHTAYVSLCVNWDKYTLFQDTSFLWPFCFVASRDVFSLIIHMPWHDKSCKTLIYGISQPELNCCSCTCACHLVDSQTVVRIETISHYYLKCKT